jgi:hypothetical protein
MMTSVTAPSGAALSLSPFQERLLAVPEAYDLFLGGGRGGAKPRPDGGRD